MPLHIGLLAEAQRNLTGFVGRPSQARLKRAASTSYYAGFHRLTYESSKIIVSGDRPAARNYLRRGYKHGTMKELCLTISAGRLPKRWPIKLTDIHADLRLACSIFTELLDARHRADYDVGVDISLAEARSLVDAAEQFQTLMDTLSQDKSEAFRLFAIALLAQPSIY